MTEERVTWDEVAPEAYHAGGTFQVAGAIDMSDQPVSVLVTVEDSYAVESAACAVETPAGVAPELPATLAVTWSNGDVTEEPVAWPAVDAAELVDGSVIALDTAFENAAVDLRAEATVTVTPAVAVAPQTPGDVTTMAGIAPVLPAQVGVTMSDYSTTQAPVTWEAVGKTSYAIPGSFTVQGAVEGLDIAPVQITVNVTDATVRSIESVYVTTEAGVKPELPASVGVTWSNGQTTQEVAAWDKVLGGQYANPGTFLVEGTVVGSTMTATVTVSEPAPAEAKELSPVQLGVGGGILAALAAAIAFVANKLRKNRTK